MTKADRRAITEYAESKNIKIGSISIFDGDMELIKGQIDTLSEMQKMLPLGKKISLSVANMDDDDFGITNQTNISVNFKAMRSRSVTTENILNGNYFASRTVEDIAAHEYGHVFTALKGNKGIEFAKEAYYNTFNEVCTDEKIVEYLRGHVSMYCVALSGAKFKEIIPEILAKHNSSADRFTSEFVKLLKGV